MTRGGEVVLVPIHNREDHPDMQYWTYIIQSTMYGRYYIGQTNDVDDRIQRHNNGESKSTKAFRPWELVYKKGWITRTEAIQHEQYLKSLKNKKYFAQCINDAGWRSSISLGS